ncbi:MAG: glycerol-3-phosphate 1-O-acyltransferase PlsY [Elusimicrobia bacterium]|nr:glycerol-3-phosphate 1-O-acyltransferase PlsY [Elusimicrobiota bacterium]
MLGIIILMILSYVLGGIPTGYIITRYLRGIDIRNYGSGNPGTANVYRTVGTWPGIITFLIDFAKGLIPTLAAAHFYPDKYGIIITCGALAIAGHIWTIFLGFRGGKGVATSAGVFSALIPSPIAIAFIVFVIAVSITKHISIGSICAAFTLPAVSYGMNKPVPYTVMALIVCALIIFTHIPNIRRIIKGKELDYKFNKNSPNDKEQK